MPDNSNKFSYQFKKITAPGATTDELKAFTRKLNAALEDLYTKIYGYVQIQDLSQGAQTLINSKAGSEELATAIEQTDAVITATATALGGQISQVQQTANKITWLIGNSASQATMTFTQAFLELAQAALVISTIRDGQSAYRLVATGSGIELYVGNRVMATFHNLGDDFLRISGAVDAMLIAGDKLECRGQRISIVSSGSADGVYISGGLYGGKIQLRDNMADMSVPAISGSNQPAPAIWVKANGDEYTDGITTPTTYANWRYKQPVAFTTCHFLPHLNSTGGGVGYVLGDDNHRWFRLFSNTSVNTASDRALKTDIAPLEKAEELLDGLKPVFYRFKDDTTELHMGFIAQDALEVLEALEMTDSDLVTGDDGSYGMTYSELIAPLVAGYQAQKRRADDLEKRLARLEALLEVDHK